MVVVLPAIIVLCKVILGNSIAYVLYPVEAALVAACWSRRPQGASLSVVVGCRARGKSNKPKYSSTERNRPRAFPLDNGRPAVLHPYNRCKAARAGEPSIEVSTRLRNPGSRCRRR